MKKKLLKIFLVLFGIGLFVGICTYLYVFHKPHRNIANEKPAYTLNAFQLLDEFNVSEDSSYIKYGDKVLQVDGKIEELSSSDTTLSIILSNPEKGISCSFEAEYCLKNKDRIKQLKIGTPVTLKGKCDGYDMIMGVVLTRCVLL